MPPTEEAWRPSCLRNCASPNSKPWRNLELTWSCATNSKPWRNLELTWSSCARREGAFDRRAAPEARARRAGGCDPSTLRKPDGKLVPPLGQVAPSQTAGGAELRAVVAEDQDEQGSADAG